MRFDASLKRLQDAVKELEKASKAAAKKKSGVLANQQDLFGGFAPQTSDNDNVDFSALKNQLDQAINSVETLLKESA